MAITVGTDTYISLADAQAYAVQNGLVLGADNAATETLLKRAAVSMDRIYGNKYLGSKQEIGQPMAWPRDYYGTQTRYPRFDGEPGWLILDSDGNPRDFSGLQPELGQAQTELAALLQANVNVYAQPAPQVASFTNKVDTLEESKTLKNAQGYQENQLYKIALILRPILINNSGNIAITRGA